VERSDSPAVAQAVMAFREYWTATLQRAEPYWFQLDLTISQLKGLILLEVRQELTIGAIADKLGILVEQMVQARLATRIEDQADRRRSIVRLTQEGRDLAARLHRGEEQSMAEVFACLQPHELVALTAGLNALTTTMLGTDEASRSLAP
jgi:DNA-binding MarR family transcriptional regulator